MKKKNGLPERWLAYKNIGERIAGTPFIAFKVPLGENFFSRMRPCDRFTPDELVDTNPDMRLIIDLTNTDRYYSVESIESKGVKYCKLSCRGRTVPPEKLISKFCDVVHEFLSSSSTNGQDTVIGVHCTHGVNRTGFMICSFMIRHLLIQPREAIRVFEAARGHSIERQEYVEALVRQYSRNMGQRRRRTPPRGIPPIRSTVGANDDRSQPVQRYSFGALTFPSLSSMNSWTPAPNPPAVSWRSTDHRSSSPFPPAMSWRSTDKGSPAPNTPAMSWRSTDQGSPAPNPPTMSWISTGLGNSRRSTGSAPQPFRVGAAPEPEAGPSTKTTPNESHSATHRGADDGQGGESGGFRKGKKDKRKKKKQRPSTVGADGGDCVPHAGGLAKPESAHLQISSSVNQDQETRYAEESRRRGAGSKKQSAARTRARDREPSPKAGAVVSCQSRKDSAVSASTAVTHSASPPDPVPVLTSARAAAKVIATFSATVSVSVSATVSAADSATVSSAVPVMPAVAPLSVTFASATPPRSPSPSFPGRSPTTSRSCSPASSRSPLFACDRAFPSLDTSDDSKASSEFYWRFSSRDSPNANKFDPYELNESVPRCLLARDESDESSPENASTSSWGSWPGSYKAASDASYDYAHGPKYDIECIPHYETASDVEYDPELAPSLSLESGLSPDLSDLDLDAIEDEIENLSAGGGLGGMSVFCGAPPPNDQPTAPPRPEQPQPPLPQPSPPPPPPPSPPAPPAPQHQVVIPLPPPPPQVLEDLPPRLGFHINENPQPNQDRDREADRDRDLDWEAILASLHDHTRASAGRASRYAMRSSPAPAPGERGGDTSGDEDVVMVGLNRRIRRRRRRSIITTIATYGNATSASTSEESPRRPGERGPNMERGPRASAPARIPSHIGSIRIGGPKEPRFHASPPYTDCKRVKASSLRI